MQYKGLTLEEIRVGFGNTTEVPVLQVREDGTLYQKIAVAFTDFRGMIQTLVFPTNAQ